MTAAALRTTLRELLEAGGLDLPFPGGGDTASRFEGLMALTRRDVALGRLVEAHADAVAILAEAGRPAEPGILYGVWAADFDGSRVVAERQGSGWRLDGTRAWCSGAGLLDAALVTTTDGEHTLLFEVRVDHPGLAPDPTSWPVPALAATTTWTTTFAGVEVPDGCLVGPPGFYTGRPGFWHGSVGVAAAWAGGALGVADAVLGRPSDDTHRLVHAGAVHAATWTLRAVLAEAAREIDDDPDDRAGAGMVRALTVRHVVERAATTIIDRCGRALGASALAMDSAHARRVADLSLYLRQHHSEHDLALIGQHVLPR